MAEPKDPPKGRFERFRKLATLSAQIGSDVVKSGVKRFAGSETELLGKITAERLVATLGDLKGAAMKIGQAASMDPDLFSPDVQKILSRLQNQAPAMSYARVEETIEAELGAKPLALFRTFDETPTAAASLGQVHRATLEDGREVVVKIQYPGMEQALKSDLNNLGALVKAVSLTSKSLDGRTYYKEIARELTAELDYEREARLAEEFRVACVPFPDLKVPDVVLSRTSLRVLTLEFLPGITLKDFLQSEPSDDARFKVSRLLIRAINGPFLMDGVAHADPHPGNFMVMPDGRLGIMDFGSIKRFSPAFVAAHRGTFRAVVTGEHIDVLKLVRSVGFEVALPDAEAVLVLDQILHIAGRALRTDSYDYAQCKIAIDMRNYFASNAPKLLRLRPPPEAILFFRSFGGLAQNLRALAAKGDFRAVYVELADQLDGLLAAPQHVVSS